MKDRPPDPAAAAVEALAPARAHDRGARAGVRVAAAAVHRLRGGLGRAGGTRRVGGGRPARARARSRSHRGPDVPGVLARPRPAARKRGVPLLELRRATAPSAERECRPVRLLPRRRIRAGRLGPRGARLVHLPDDRAARASARRARGAARHRPGQRHGRPGGRNLARGHGCCGHRRVRLSAR